MLSTSAIWKLIGNAASIQEDLFLKIQTRALPAVAEVLLGFNQTEGSNTYFYFILDIPVRHLNSHRPKTKQLKK
jgi:hypothetical protein